MLVLPAVNLLLSMATNTLFYRHAHPCARMEVPLHLLRGLWRVSTAAEIVWGSASKRSFTAPFYAAKSGLSLEIALDKPPF